MTKTKELLKKAKTLLNKYDFNGCIQLLDEIDEDREYTGDIIGDDLIDEMAKSELEKGGIQRLFHFMGTYTPSDDYHLLDGYGNLQRIEKEDLECIIEDLEKLS